MQRYFIKQDQVHHHQVVIKGDDYHHITRVMRMKEHDTFFAATTTGETALCEIVEITNEKIIATIIEWSKEQRELPIHVTIASGLPKGDKLEYILQKGTELGASEFVPFKASRSIVKWDEKKGMKKVDRWEKIMKEASEQSHRNMLPTVSHPKTVHELIEYSKQFDMKLVAYEEEAKQGEKSVLAQTLDRLSPGQSLLVVFGPEGGLETKEVEQLLANKFQACGLGPRILRTETAPLYLLSAVSYYFELSR